MPSLLLNNHTKEQRPECALKDFQRKSLLSQGLNVNQKLCERAMSPKKPCIAITYSADKSKVQYWATRVALFFAGAKSIGVTKTMPPLKTPIDGVIITGGIDVHPDLYDKTLKEKPNYPYDRQRDRLEIAWIKWAHTEKRPILGLCRGAQLMNVVRGGTLHYDVAKAYEKAQYPSSLLAKIFYRKWIFLNNQQSLFKRILKVDKVKVNSMHTQAIDKLGKGLIITAQEANGVVQAFEDPDLPFCVGVQYHPELMIYSPLHFRLFRAFVKAAVTA